MLSRLYIENVAVIEKTQIEFDKGFNVLTGETGAGKSILIDSIDLVLGERANRELIRHGASNAYVSAYFINISNEILTVMNENDIKSEEDNSILIERELSCDGKNVCKINGRQVTLSTLKIIGRKLVNMHGQHANQALLNSDTHITYLDQYAENSKERSEYYTSYENVVSIKKQLSKIYNDTNDLQAKSEYLRYQIEELEAADLKEDEEQTLVDRRNSLVNSEKIMYAVNTAYECLCGDEVSANQLISTAYKELANVNDFSNELNQSYQQLTEIYDSMNTVTQVLSDFRENFEFSQYELNEIEARLNLINKLKKKYGSSIKEILENLSEAKAELENLEFSDEKIEQLESALEKESKILKEKAAALTNTRLTAGEKFAKNVMKEFEYLDMAKVKFEVVVSDIVDTDSKVCYRRNGKDNVEFFIATNIGDTAKPLSKIASGGELSRIMLSIKNVLADSDDIDTLIFDEIDTGVSGKAAQKIGIKLRQAGENRQIICVTHLAQIAAVANAHHLIEKNVENENTYTKVTNLDYDGRIKEVARIIGGIDTTDTTIAAAKEMLKIQ